MYTTVGGAATGYHKDVVILMSGDVQNIERLAALLEAADMMLPRGEPRPRKRIAEYLIARGATPGV